MEVFNIERSMKRARSGGTFKFFKINFLGVENEIYSYELMFADECLNPFKTVQGGMIASALDEVTSISVNILTNDEFLPSSTDIHITYHRPLTSGKVLGTAKIIQLGKTIVSIEGRLYSNTGKLSATALHTAVLKKTCELDISK
ncbi:PaaI family thioesterase [Alphaproteobacteria bacterium]|nr:PaaI family thioesterase [Alphaproteobacteria bacterium]